MTWYSKNKEHALQWQREYRKKKHEQILENRRRYDKENHDRLLELKRQWKNNNPDKYKKQKKKDDHNYWLKNKTNQTFIEKEKQRHSLYHQQNKEKRLLYGKIYRQKPEVKERRRLLERIRNKNNPRSNRGGTIELQLAMNNVRKRDHNTCKWYGCGLTFRQAPIHVHHIFPRAEYPELELIESYMICYCANHHGLWHRMRGDKYSEWIGSKREIDNLTLSARGRN